MAFSKDQNQDDQAHAGQGASESLAFKCGLVLVLVLVLSSVAVFVHERGSQLNSDYGRAIAESNDAQIAVARFKDRLHVAEHAERDHEAWLSAGKALQDQKQSLERLSAALIVVGLPLPSSVTAEIEAFQKTVANGVTDSLESGVNGPSVFEPSLRLRLDAESDDILARLQQNETELQLQSEQNAKTWRRANLGVAAGLFTTLALGALFLLSPLSQVAARELEGLRAQRDHVVRSRRLLISMFERVPTATVLILEGALHLNREAQKMTGITESVLPSLDEWFKIVFPNQVEEARAEYLAHKKTGFLNSNHFDFKNRQDIQQSVSFSGYADGDIELWIMQDITARRRAEERFQLLFERSSDPHILWDDYGLIDCNEAAVKALRCRDKTHLLSLHMAVFSPEWQPDGRPSLEKMHEMSRLAHENGLQRFEWTQRRFDGVAIESSVILNSIEFNGRRAILSVWHDISVRKQMERELREKQMFLQRLVEHLPVALYCKDGANDLRYTVWNRQAEEIWGVSAHEAIGHREQDFGTRTMEIQAEMDLIAAGRAVEIEAEQVESRDSSQRIVRSVKVPLTDGSGRPRFLLGISENITERKRIENELKLREAALVEAQKLAKTGSFEIDVMTQRGLWSQQAASNLGLPPETDLETVKWRDVIHPEDVEAVFNELEQCRTGKRILNMEFRVVKPDGSTSVISSYAKPVIEDQGRCTKIVGTLQDVTEKKRQEQLIRSQEVLIFQSAKMSSLGEMAGGIAHEINNPLAIIQSAADQLSMRIERGHLDPERANALVNKITSTTERIAKIIQGLRTFARDGKTDPLEQKDLKAILEETLEFCRTRFKNHGIELNVKLPEEEALVDCRPIEISQVALNLLNNAFDAVEGCELRKIDVEIRVLEKTCELRVSDSGAGVPAEVRDRIFLPFFTTKEVGKGTGLGLSISAEIIRAHNGILDLDDVSKQDVRGTTFLIVLPRQLSTQQLTQRRGAA